MYACVYTHTNIAYTIFKEKHLHLYFQVILKNFRLRKEYIKPLQNLYAISTSQFLFPRLIQFNNVNYKT